MPNLSKVIFPNRWTSVHSQVLWAGLTLALVGADTRSALAMSVPLSQSVLRLDPSLEFALNHRAASIFSKQAIAVCESVCESVCELGF
ncbi:MAG: hypothetical protein HC781_14365 [Leptolyngbyaceae cyanobacterium CSU_1_4]|nr:hypothetical protein [Leptolyngbyaceae cyanobacterium CSU_1_4]